MNDRISFDQMPALVNARTGQGTKRALNAALRIHWTTAAALLTETELADLGITTGGTSLTASRATEPRRPGRRNTFRAEYSEKEITAQEQARGTPCPTSAATTSQAKRKAVKATS